MEIFPTCLFYHLYKKFVIKFSRSQLFLLRHQCEQFCSRFIKMGQVNCTVKCCSPSGPSPGEIAAASGPPGTIRNPNKSQAKMFEENKRKAIVGQEEIAKDDNCKSLVKKYLTKDLAVQLGKKQTKMGATLWDCIQSGVANLDSGVGIYAPDAESYTVFADIFYPIIKDYHIGFDPITQKHPQTDFGLDQLEQLRNPDPENMYIISTRIRCGRSLKGYPFNPLLTKEQYKEMEQKVRDALKSLEGKHAGTYYSLAGMPKDVQQRLIDDHFLFKEGDRFLQEAQACRFWPTGRGIFHNQAKTFLVWCNEEDHLRIISMQAGGDVKEVYARLITGAQQIEKKLQFSRDATLGYLTFCPTNLGTTIRASVHIKLPRIAAKEEEFKKIALKYNLQVRGTSGEHTESKGGVYDVSNKRRMGLTEFQAVKEMYDGIVELIKLEKQATIAS